MREERRDWVEKGASEFPMASKSSFEKEFRLDPGRDLEVLGTGT